MQCIDIAQLCRISAAQGVLTCVDNTFCTPILQRPLSLGADFVIHSTTKYLNGHGNSIAGAIIGKDEKWKQQVWTSLKLSGAICSPWEAWLVYNGIKTLHLRMERHNVTDGLALASIPSGSSRKLLRSRRQRFFQFFKSKCRFWRNVEVLP